MNKTNFLDSEEICPYCGSKLNRNKSCPKIDCKSHEFSVGNRIVLYNRPDFGFGFITEILDYKTPYEFCADIDERIPKETSESDSESFSEKSSLFYEKPVYSVRFKLYHSKVFAAEELRHDIFKKDRQVRTKFGIGTIKTINIQEKLNKITYDVVMEDNRIKNLKENEIIEYVHNPIDSLLNFTYTDPEKFALNFFSKTLHNTYSSNTIKFVTNSRLTLMPHQVYIAHELIMKYMPRYILADEVGLGKTIEAGIFIKEMISRDLAKKILIIVPANLVDQWIFEFENKFSIKLTRFDSKFVRNIDRCDHPNVFYRIDTAKEYPYIISSMQFARSAKNRRILTDLYWDYVIFDEAHHLRRYLNGGKGAYHETLAYTLARKLGEKTNSLLLLTATPIQLHSFDLYSLLQLIRPDIFTDFDDFESERKKIPLINMLIRNLQNWRELNTFQRSNTIDLVESILITPPLVSRAAEDFYNASNESKLSESSLEGMREQLTPTNKDPSAILHVKEIIHSTVIEPERVKTYNYDTIERMIRTRDGRISLIKKLQKHHFLSYFMFRNRKRLIFKNQFNERIVKRVSINQTEEEFELYNQIRLYLAKTYNQAMDSKNNALGFVMVILQKLATSSPPALISSLEKRIAKIEQFIKDKGWKDSPDNYLDEFSLEEDDWDDWAEVGAVAIDRVEQAMMIKKERDMNIKHLQVLKEFLERLKMLQHDSKLQALLRIVKKINKKGPKKVIIFTQFMKTLFYLKEHLANLGNKVEVFHGSLTREQKNAAVERFKKDYNILICTEAGGEGRNFQFCSIIVNYDLPWNPMKLEQRIGRLDRIGQKRDVIIYNFTTEGTVENRIMDILSERILLFEESIGNLEPIVANIEKSINKAVLSEENIVNAVEIFNEELTKNQDKMEIVKNQLEDFILDKKSFQLEKIDQFLSSSSHPISEIDILALFELFFKFSDSNIDLRKTDNKIPYYEISLNSDTKLKLNAEFDKFSGVFDLDLAQKLEFLDFFALGHPLVTNLIDYCRTGALGNPSTVLRFNYENILSKIKPIAPKEEIHAIELFRTGKIDIFLYIFESEFNGIFVEKNIYPVFITSKGFVLQALSNYLSRPHNFYENMIKNGNEISEIEINKNLSNIDERLIKSLENKAKMFYKKYLGKDKKELVRYNEIMFQKELQRKFSLFEYKRRFMLRKIKIDEERLKYLESKKPTKRQLINLEKMEDPQKKAVKKKKYDKITNEIYALNNEIYHLKDKLDSLDFDLPEDIKRLEFYRKLSRRLWLSQIGYLIR